MRFLTTLGAGACLAGLLGIAGCEGETVEAVDAAAPDQGIGQPQCAEDPTTHAEIINACTAATAVRKTPITPLLREDGTLPPLP